MVLVPGLVVLLGHSGRARCFILRSDFQGPNSAMCAGGAGTTAAGLLAACPTTVIFFFGDQVLHNKLSFACAATGCTSGEVYIAACPKHLLQLLLLSGARKGNLQYNALVVL
jgi:hypothetical protein